MRSKNWIKRIIYFQERKVYNFYTILGFALFVGGIRTIEEVMLAQRRYYHIDILNNCVFYLLMVFAYTLVVAISSKTDWKKVINAVLIGVFLGIFPPIIDVFVYGLGNFKYSYFVGLPGIKELLFFNYTRGFPVGEGIVLWSTIIFSAYYIHIKTSSYKRSLLGGLGVYVIILLISGMFIPTIASVTAKSIPMRIPSMLVTSIFQLIPVIVFYLILNPQIFANLIKRRLHCLPFVLLTFMGGAVSGGINPFTIFIASMVFYAGLVTLVQNDFFDKEEDSLSGRYSYVTGQDVLFFNTTYLIFVFLLYNVKSMVFLPLILLYIVSVLYNYDFYRAKRFFPANYKIEGIWGLGSFLAGIFSQKSFVFTPEIIVFSFLIFGGWSLVSSFKDYKDIEADKAVGNQTGYIILMKTGLSLKQAHRIVSTVILLCFAVPAIWLFFKNVHILVCVLFPLITIPPLWYVLSQRPCTSTVRNVLVVITIYLFLLLLVVISIYQNNPLPR
ncbi:MAG: hypothetical protein J7L53_02930 [Deltaproteobacteria bacterium]|nr:hypothetical protein [Deltaproteobacteria bacterium]